MQQNSGRRADPDLNCRSGEALQTPSMGIRSCILSRNYQMLLTTTLLRSSHTLSSN